MADPRENPQNPAPEEKMFYIPDPPPDPVLNIVPDPSGSVLKFGQLHSPNYVKNKTGWMLNSQGVSEFNTGVSILGSPVVTQGNFGGDGSDGALNISSGTTNIDLGASAVVIKNYSSISITGTAKLTFSNPHAGGSIVYLKCQGACVLTSSTTPLIDLSGMGASPGNSQNLIIDTTQHFGTNGTAGSAGTNGPGGAGGAIYDSATKNLYTTVMVNLARKFMFLVPGAGGGNGGAGYLNAGVEARPGGGGGGAGSYNAAGGVGGTNAAGSAAAGSKSGGGGGSGTANFPTAGGGGGGGGGDGGMAVILYKTATASSGTIDNSGGAGGKGGFTTNGAGTGGNGGGALVIECNGDLNFTGTIYVKGLIGGNAADSGGNAGGAGGASTGGLVTKNTYFA